MCLRKTRVDYCKRQINQKKGADENNWQEKHKWVITVWLLVLYHNIRPAFQRDALENDQQAKHNIIEVSNAIVRVRILFAAKITVWADISSATNKFVVKVGPFFDMNTPFFKDAT